jgi:hypothetical protein
MSLDQSEFEFELTYPAFIISINQQTPQYVMMNDDWCLCVFTDKDLAERFVEKYYPPDKLPKIIEYVRQSGPRDLLRSLTQNEPRLTKEGVRHLAIDVTPGIASLQVLISDAIKILSYAANHETHFDFTFPSYFVTNSQGSPCCGLAGDESCVCLFTDRNVAVRFIEDIDGPNSASKDVVYVSVADRRDLLRILNQNYSWFVKLGIQRLVIDSTPGKLSLTLPIIDVIERLTQQTKNSVE